MSMYGSVTDAQVFSRELSDLEMVDMTTCKYEYKCKVKEACYDYSFIPQGVFYRETLLTGKEMSGT